MNRIRVLLAVLGGAGMLAAAGLVMAQDNRTAPVVPAAPPVAPAPAAPVTTALPNTPQGKALANAVTPEEGPPPPKAAETTKPVLKAAEPPPEAKAPAEPMKRPRYTAAVMQAVDKLTAETLRFETKVGEPVRFKGLILTVRACEATAPDETAPDNVAFLDVQSQPISTPGHAAAPPRQVFRGWMFAGAPGLHPFEHPIYDVWLIACKTPAPVEATPKAVKSPPVPAKASAKRT